MRATRDWKAIADLTEDVDTRLCDDQKSAARRIVCGFAQGGTLQEQAADALALMEALGIHPNQIDDDSFRDVPALRYLHK